MLREVAEEGELGQLGAVIEASGCVGPAFPAGCEEVGHAGCSGSDHGGGWAALARTQCAPGTTHNRPNEAAGGFAALRIELPSGSISLRGGKLKDKRSGRVTPASASVR